MKRLCAIAVLCLAGMFPGGAACAQELMASPRRLVRLFDFEDTNDAGVKIGRGVDMPRNWYAIGRDPLAEDANFLAILLHQRMAQRPGYPQHGQIGYDTSEHASGEFSLGLKSQGGNTGAYLSVGALPALPESDYLVTAKIKTKSLERAGAVLLAYFVDQDGQRINASAEHTTLLQDQDTENHWTAVDLKLRGKHKHVAYIGIEFHIIQPTPDPDHPLAEQQVVAQDVEGEAWVDDIGIWQLPSIELNTQSPVNLIRAPEKPRIEAGVRDLAGRNLFAKVAVYDLDRRLVATQVQPIFPGSPAKWSWEPSLEEYGWYLTELLVFDDAEGKLPYRTDTEMLAESGLTPVARSHGAFLYLPPSEPAVGPDMTRFRLDAEGVAIPELEFLPAIMKGLGLHAVSVSAWSRATTLVDVASRQDTLASILEKAMETGDEVTISFNPVPRDLEQTDGVNSEDPVTVFSQPSNLWMPFAQPVLVAMGQWVHAWQIGDQDQPSEALRPSVDRKLAAARDAFSQWAPEPVFALTGAVTLPNAAANQHLAHSRVWPNGVQPESLAEHVLPDAQTPGRPLNLMLETLPANHVAHLQRASDLARRMIAAWELLPEVSLGIGPRWSGGSGDELRLLPDPLLGVFSNVSRRLIGKRVIGEIDLGPGVRCLVLQSTDSDTGSLVVWNDQRRPAEAWFEMYLGDTPVMIDIWGNREKPAEKGGKHRVDLTPTPVFIEGINLNLARFRAGFGLNASFIESTQVPHQRLIRVSNPWPITLNGRFTITGPGRWTVNPQRHLFSLAPGATTDLPVALSFPVNEPAGYKTMTARFEFQADREYVIDMSTPMAVGLENVRFEATLRLDRTTHPGQTDVLATCIVTNIGDEDISLNVFASHIGHPYAERLIPRLEPGQAAIKNFRFPDAGASVATAPVLCGVREVNGPAVLNRHLTLLNAP